MKKTKRWMTILAGGLFILLVVGPFAVVSYERSTVRYYAVCIHCGQDMTGKRTTYYGVPIRDEKIEIQATAIFNALERHLAPDHSHEWSEWTLNVVYRKFRERGNGRGGFPLVRRFNHDPVFVDQLAGIDNGPRLWRVLLELEKSHFSEFIKLPILTERQITDAPGTRPNLKEWWRENEEHLRRTMGGD